MGPKNKSNYYLDVEPTLKMFIISIFCYFIP